MRVIAVLVLLALVGGPNSLLGQEEPAAPDAVENEDAALEENAAEDNGEADVTASQDEDAAAEGDAGIEDVIEDDWEMPQLPEDFLEDDVFIPTEEIEADEEVVFPVNI
jgi:hypothetical protein